MKRQISLKLFVTLAFLLLGVTLIIGYSLLSTHYYHLGMDTVTASEMEGVARSYLRSVAQAERAPMEHFNGFQVAERWSELPLQLQQLLDGNPPAPGLSIKTINPGLFRGPDSVYFVFHYQMDDETLFVVRHGTRANAPPLIGRNAAKSRKMLLGISVSSAVILGAVITLLLRRVSKPVVSLGQWARSLTPERLSEPPPDFSYPELNELADMMRTSLSSVQASLAREHNFLRHASHELRTPIAIIRNSIELLHKIKESMNLKNNRKLDKVVDRIDRASLNMQHLTETLLWLSRNEMERLPAKELQLDCVIMELVEEMNYLLDRKNIQLDVKTSAYLVRLPEFPVRIVLGNLIRNSFQHTWEGTITIRQQDHVVSIVNPLTSNDNGQDDLGFGLGLQLTDQLTRKLGWQFNDTSTAQLHQVSIVFGKDYVSPKIT